MSSQNHGQVLAIAGVVSFTGAPVPDADGWVRKILAATPRPQSARPEQWAGPGYCFGDIRVGAERSPARGPWVGRARLDNRPSICTALRRTVGCDEPDEAIAAEYLCDSPDRTCAGVRGDWAVVSWNPIERRIVLARDPLGIGTLYYTRLSDRLVFSSSFAGLTRGLPAVTGGLDEDVLARVLLAVPRTTDATVFAGVRMIAPGTYGVARPEGMEIRRYWDPAHVRTQRMTQSDAVDGVLAHLSTAIRTRWAMAGGNTVFLSGGLDSGSVAYLASAHARAIGSALHAVSHVPAHPQIVARPSGDESPMIQLTAAACGLTSQLVSSSDVSPIVGMARGLVSLGCPIHTASNSFWIDDLLRHTAERGGQQVLSAGGGNFTLSWAGVHRRSARARLADAHREGAAAVAARAVRWSWRQLAGLVSRRPEHVAGASDRLLRSALAEHLLRTGDAWRADRRQQRLTRLCMPFTALGERASTWGLTVTDPTLDQALVEHCLAVPDEHYVNHAGARQIVRVAMRGRLPDAVLDAPAKGLQAGDLIARLRGVAPQVEALLAALEASALVAHYLDVPRMRRVWREAQQHSGLATHQRCVSVLTRPAMIGMFLLEFERGAAGEWTASRTR